MQKISMDYKETLSKLKKDLLKRLEKYVKRRKHVEGVASCMMAFSIKYDLDIEKAQIIAYLHDLTKYESITYHMKNIDQTDKDIFKNVKIFNNIKYKWGGRTFNGIDCSALIQVCLQYNNKYCPRDSGQQIKFFKKNINLKKINKNDIIYWKGHVALALSKNNLIHAYGPKKKTVIMDIKKTVKLIEKTAQLKVLSIKRLI